VTQPLHCLAKLLDETVSVRTVNAPVLVDVRCHDIVQEVVVRLNYHLHARRTTDIRNANNSLKHIYQNNF
jgi:hypothetical protein